MTYALAPYGEAPYAGLATAPAAATAGVMPISEFAIEFDPGVWTDVEVHRVSASTRRGRNAESGAFETGRGFVTLRNETRVYDPEYAAGPYYGKLRPNRRVRYRANYGGATYPVMVGYIDRITQDYPGPNEIVATIAFSDRFKILNRQELAVSAYAATILGETTQPQSWWRFDEPAGSTTVRDTSGGRVATVVGAPTLGAPTLLVRDPGAAVAFANATDWITLPIGTLPTTPSWTMEFWYNASASFNNQILIHESLNGPGQVVIQTGGAGTGYLTIDMWSGGPGAHTGAFKVADGVTHHVAIVSAAGSVLKIWVDGIDRTASSTGATVPLVDAPTIINSTAIAASQTIDEMAFWPVALTATQIAAHNDAGRTPWRNDLPGPRLGRILDAVGVAAADRNLDAGTTTLQSTSLGGTALAYMQTVADTEIGALFVDRTGVLRFIGRRQGLGENPAYLTSRATLVDEPPAATDTPYTSVTFEVDESDIVTRATVSREGSVAVTYSDPAAVAEFGTIDFVAEGLLHDSDTYSSDYAQWIVNTRKVPETRVGDVQINPARVPTVAFPAMLSLELGDRVTLTRRPKVGAAITRDFRVEAIAHSNAAKQWGVTLTLSPFNQANNLPVFTWGVTQWGNQVWGL